MNDIKIDWSKVDAKEFLDKALEGMSKGLVDSIEIKHIVSGDFINMYEVNDIEDFNGWECDWWSNMHYNEKIFSVSGGAFYGTIRIDNEE